jgi:hypothetical protein
MAFSVVFQEVDSAGQAGGGISAGQEPPRSCFQLEEEDDVRFAQNPLNFVAFLEIFKAGLILLDLMNKINLGKSEIIQGLSC